MFSRVSRSLPVSFAVLFLLSVSRLLAQAPPIPPDPAVYGLSIEVHFSPKGGCKDAVVRELNAAHSTVLVQAYEFTSEPIATALIEAHKRGVKVSVILDRTVQNQKNWRGEELRKAEIDTFLAGKPYHIEHNKTMVIDSSVVITGSFNFSEPAETSNAENLLVIRNTALAERYAKDWEDRRKARNCEPYKVPKPETDKEAQRAK